MEFRFIFEWFPFWESPYRDSIGYVVEFRIKEAIWL
jgi:hypothetical protein